MASKKIFTWPLPFGDKCDPRCENDLHNAYCMIFPALGTIVALLLIGSLRSVFTFDFLSRYSLSYQGAVLITLAAFAIFFAATWRWQKKITVFIWCRRCKKPEEKKPTNEGFMYII